nr:MAG TPA: hypothetical protein [Caudoviricetes sp.]
MLPKIPQSIAHLAIFHILSSQLSRGSIPPPIPPKIAPFLMLENGEVTCLRIPASSFLAIPSASPLATCVSLLSILIFQSPSCSATFSIVVLISFLIVLSPSAFSPATSHPFCLNIL